MLGDDIEDLVFIGCCINFSPQSQYAIADVFIVDLLPFGDSGVIADDRKAIDPQILFQWTEVEIEKFFQHFKIIFRDRIHAAAFCCTNAFTCQRKRILICDHEKRQIALPEILIKSVIGGNIQQFFNLHIAALHQIFRECCLLFPVTPDPSKLF